MTKLFTQPNKKSKKSFQKLNLARQYWFKPLILAQAYT